MVMPLELPLLLPLSKFLLLDTQTLFLVTKRQRLWPEPTFVLPPPPNKQGFLRDGGFLCHSFPPSKLRGDTRSASSGGNYTIEGLPRRKRQELLWQDYFLDPTHWWDNRSDKRSTRHPDFRHKTSKECLWLDSRHKPEWVDSQLARWDAEMKKPAGSSDCPNTETDGGPADEGHSMINRLCDEGELRDAVEALELLVLGGCQVSDTLFYRVLKMCMAESDLTLGSRVHCLALRGGHESNAFLANQVIGMYASHGKLEETVQAFRKVSVPNAYMWSSIILAHARHGQPREAINFYREMRETSVKPDNHIFVAVLKACASAEDLGFGKLVHADISVSALRVNIFVGNSLVSMYAKCGSLEDARKVFDRLPSRDVVTWTAMIAGYTQQGLGREALVLYGRMQQQGITPADHFTLACLLRACASVGALHQGKLLHEQVREQGLEVDLVVANCLVDMYAKCGSLEAARRVFDALPKRDVVTWSALLNGYAEHGNGQMAIQCFEKMLQHGVEPNGTTFLCLLVACSHAGLVREGQQYFRMMVEVHGISPTDSHYNCMVDILGRSGLLDEAEDILRTEPFENYMIGWSSLLSACKSHGDTERGRRCFEHLVELEPANATSYVLMANIYASAGRWNDVDRIEHMRKSAAAWKKPAKVCIEVNKEVHEFTVGEDRSDITSKLKSVNARLKEEGGHVPQTELVLKTVSEKEKEDALCGHAEKLALAYGLLNTPDGTPLLVTKNLRMCSDCHSSTKILSRLERREIVVRDAHRVHHFQGGSCSCGDRH